MVNGGTRIPPYAEGVLLQSSTEREKTMDLFTPDFLFGFVCGILITAVLRIQGQKIRKIEEAKSRRWRKKISTMQNFGDRFTKEFTKAGKRVVGTEHSMNGEGRYSFTVYDGSSDVLGWVSIAVRHDDCSVLYGYGIYLSDAQGNPEPMTEESYKKILGAILGLPKRTLTPATA